MGCGVVTQAVKKCVTVQMLDKYYNISVSNVRMDAGDLYLNIGTIKCLPF